MSDNQGNIFAVGRQKFNPTKRNVFKYDGTNWSVVAGIDSLNSDYTINSIAVDNNNNIYAGGNLKDSLGRIYIAKFNGNSWSKLGGSTSAIGSASFDVITKIACDAFGNIYTTGFFTDASSGTGKLVMKFDGLSWSTIGDEVSLQTSNSSNSYLLNTLNISVSGSVYTSALFQDSVGNILNNTKFYNGTNWQILQGPRGGLKTNGYLNAITKDTTGNVYVGGKLISAAGKSYLAKWNGLKWSNLPDIPNTDINTEIFTLASDNYGNVYASGRSMYNANDTSAKHFVAKWDGVNWTELGGIKSSITNSAVRKIIIDKIGNLYAVGDFFLMTSAYAQHFVAKWNKNSNLWSVVGNNPSLSIISSGIKTVEIDTIGNLYVAGDFKNSAGNYFVAKWDKASDYWSELGGANSLDINDRVNVIKADKYGNIYVAGNFDTLSQTANPFQYIAKFDGLSWSKSLQMNNSTLFGATLDNIYSLDFDTSDNLFCFNSRGYNQSLVTDFKIGNTWSRKVDYIGYGKNYSVYNSLIDKNNRAYIVGALFQNYNGNSCVYTNIVTNILPLKLLSFTAQKESNNVLLNWQTANEVNVSHFNIQRSLNGRDFINIGKVNVGVSSYSFLDDKLPNTHDKLTLTYRLEIIDKDGSKTYSEVRQLAIDNKQFVIGIYPNPAKDVVTIECKGMKQVSIFNCLGLEISRQEPKNNAAVLNVQELAKGLYLVKVITANGATVVDKFIKQ